MFMEGTSQEHLLMAGEKNILIEDTNQVHLLMAVKKTFALKVQVRYTFQKHSH